MKKTLIFVAGVITGAILIIFTSLLITNDKSSNNGITLFEKDGECVSENSFEVFQVLDSGNALAHELEESSSISLPTGLTVLILCENGKAYYDDQIIKVPSGKCAKQIGIFKYSTKADIKKTVPIVSIRNK